MYDIVVYGATGFTGERTAKYLARDHGLKLAIAGRDKARLDRVAAKLGREVGVIVASSDDPASIDRMCAQGRVICTTVGPYRAYGSPVVAACVKHGAHYCDITGEAVWVRDMIDAHHEAAVQKRVKIVPFCGFDSIPSDLGALICVETLRRRGEGCRRVDAFFTMKGGINGGTFATFLQMGESGDYKRMALPFLLNEGGRPGAIVEHESKDVGTAFVHPKIGRWVAPFVMAQINTRVVRRSASLFAAEGRPYGEQFVYHEYAKMPRLQAEVFAAGLRATSLAVTKAPLRKLMKRFGPKPGQGPSEESIENGFFRTQLYAEGENGGEVSVEISAKGDPGNSATIRFLAESALMLAEGRDMTERYGVLTPATAIGVGLIDRLRRAEMTIDISPSR